MPLNWILALFLTTASTAALASGFGNYNSVLIGDMAAGMGGAFTGLTGDPAGCSYYNPATLSRMQGTSLSATANVYHKYDTEYGASQDVTGASGRINRGSFRSIPASAGSVASFGPFAIGLSIIVPSHDFYSGSVKVEGDKDLSLNISDESLWVGGNMAINITENSSVGTTVYYTSRLYDKQLVEYTRKAGATAAQTTEEKTFSSNSLIYILGYYYRFDENWSVGFSLRPPSIQVYGRGSYFYSVVDTQASTATQQSRDNIPSESRTPLKFSTGIAYKKSGKYTFSFDASYYGRERYTDVDDSLVAELVENKEIWNFALGSEIFLKHWLRLRSGIFTNFSSHPEIKEVPYRRPDHIDMLGFSLNFGVFTSDKVSFTFGGYYTGGTGYTVERLNGEYQKIRKTQQTFAMLIGSAYFF